MSQVWKFSLKLSLTLETQTILEMPGGSRVLHVAEQNNGVCLWAWVDPTRPKVKRRFDVHGTGREIPEILGTEYIGTAHLKNLGLVLHVFEVPI